MTQSSGYPYATRGSSGSSGRTCVLTLYEIRTSVDSVAKPLDCTDDWELLAERLTRRVMSRRQTLFRAAVLALVTLLNFDCLLIAQVGNTTVGSVRLSDRERLGLRGPVKTCSDFFGDDAEPMRDVEYAADGRLLVWRDNLLTGKVERVYSYDGTGTLIRVTSSGADVTEEFHYDEQGKKTRV
jgi:hypothetical protein